MKGMIGGVLCLLGVVVEGILGLKHTARASSKVSWCTAGVQGSPLEVNLPNVMHIPFNVGMDFTNRQDIKLTKIENNHILYKGNMGTLTYLDSVHNITRVDVLAPSVHMLFGVVYPLEVQIKAYSNQTGGFITLCYLFDKHGIAANPFLASGWFRENKIKNMPPSDIEYTLENDFTLKQLIEDKQGHIMYEGTSLVDNCEKTMYLISSEITWMNEQQFNELVPISQMKNTQARPLSLLMYQNFLFEWGIKPKSFSSPMDMARFPSSIQNTIDMYQPDTLHQIGFIPSNFTPGWLTPPGEVLTPVITSTPPEMKYIVYCYEPIDGGKYVPRYIPVPLDYAFTPGIQPDRVEVYVRTQEQYPNGIRDIIKIAMPVQWKPVNQTQKEELAKIAEQKAEEAKVEQVRQQVRAEMKKKEEEKMKVEMRERRIKNIVFKRVCDEWALEAIVNRHYENDDAWQLKDILKGGKRDLLICKRWRVVRVNDDGKDVDEEGNVIPDEKKGDEGNNNQTNGTNPSTGPNNSSNTTAPTSGPAADPNAPDPRLGPINVNKCGNYLLTVLNQRFRNRRVRDYIIDKCKDWKSKILPKATALARVHLTSPHPDPTITPKDLQELAEAEAVLLSSKPRNRSKRQNSRQKRKNDKIEGVVTQLMV